MMRGKERRGGEQRVQQERGEEGRSRGEALPRGEGQVHQERGRCLTGWPPLPRVVSQTGATGSLSSGDYVFVAGVSKAEVLPWR